MGKITGTLGKNKVQRTSVVEREAKGREPSQSQQEPDMHRKLMLLVAEKKDKDEKSSISIDKAAMSPRSMIFLQLIKKLIYQSKKLGLQAVLCTTTQTGSAD